MNRVIGSRLLLLLLPALAFGCRNAMISPAMHANLIPPPSLGGEPYYQPTVGPASLQVPAANPPLSPVNLAPSGAEITPIPSLSANARIGKLADGSAVPATSPAFASTSVSNPKLNTFNVSERVPADQNPIAIREGGATANLAANPQTWRGMPLNDGTRSRFAGANVNPTFGNFTPLSSPQSTASLPGQTGPGFSGRDGQWRTRSSYEGSERR